MFHEKVTDSDELVQLDEPALTWSTSKAYSFEYYPGATEYKLRISTTDVNLAAARSAS